MDRAEFMRQLESLLQDIAAQERREALQYYNDYFHDAGAENEQEVIAALGTPARVAQNIKRDLNGAGAPAKSGLSTGMLVLVILLCLLCSPILLGAGAGLLGMVISIVAVWICLILGFGVAAVVLLCLFLALFAGGAACLVAAPAFAVGVIGGGLICGGLGILCLMAAVALAGIATPAICRGVGKLWRRLFGKKQERNE